MLERVRSWWRLDDSEIEGSGEVILDPAYNPRYTAERRLRELSKAGEEVAELPADPIEAPDRP